MHASYRYLLIVVALAAMLCLLPAQGADAPSAEKPQTARETHAVEAPAGADLSVKTDRDAYLHRTMYYAPCGHSVQRREKLPARLVGLTRGALEKEIGGLYENAAVTGFSAAEVDVSTRMDVPAALGIAGGGRRPARRFAEHDRGDADRRAPDGYPRGAGRRGGAGRASRRADVRRRAGAGRISGKFKQLTKRSPRPFDTKPQSKYNKR